MTTRLFQLTTCVPSPLADGVARLLVLAGAGAVEERELGEQTELVVLSARRGTLVEIARAATGALRRAGVPLKTDIGPAPASLEGWDQAPLATLAPVHVTRTLTLVPTSGERMTRGPDEVLLGRAFVFGFGEHPTTRLAASEVERRCRSGQVRSLLDVGTGTGVLAIVGALRGAGSVRGIDTDARAVLAARRNARQNGVSGKCRFSRGTAEGAPGPFDLVVANLDFRTLLAAGKALSATVSRSGALLLSGFLHRDSRELLSAYEALGLVKERVRRDGEWALIVLVRRPLATARRAQRATARGKARKTGSLSRGHRGSPHARGTRRRT